MFLGGILAPEALARVPKERASRGGLRACPPRKFCKFGFSQVPFPTFWHHF